MIKETHDRPEDADYSQEFRYNENEKAPLLVRRVWVDAFNNFWLQSIDGNILVVPESHRKIVSKRMREATFR